MRNPLEKTSDEYRDNGCMEPDLYRPEEDPGLRRGDDLPLEAEYRLLGDAISNFWMTYSPDSDIGSHCYEQPRDRIVKGANCRDFFDDNEILYNGWMRKVIGGGEKYEEEERAKFIPSRECELAQRIFEESSMWKKGPAYDSVMAETRRLLEARESEVWSHLLTMGVLEMNERYGMSPALSVKLAKPHDGRPGWQLRMLANRTQAFRDATGDLPMASFAVSEEEEYLGRMAGASRPDDHWLATENGELRFRDPKWGLYWLDEDGNGYWLEPPKEDEERSEEDEVRPPFPDLKVKPTQAYFIAGAQIRALATGGLRMPSREDRSWRDVFLRYWIKSVNYSGVTKSGYRWGPHQYLVHHGWNDIERAVWNPMTNELEGTGERLQNEGRDQWGNTYAPQLPKLKWQIGTMLKKKMVGLYQRGVILDEVPRVVPNPKLPCLKAYVSETLGVPVRVYMCKGKRCSVKNRETGKYEPQPTKHLRDCWDIWSYRSPDGGTVQPGDLKEWQRMRGYSGAWRCKDCGNYAQEAFLDVRLTWTKPTRKGGDQTWDIVVRLFNEAVIRQFISQIDLEENRRVIREVPYVVGKQLTGVLQENGLLRPEVNLSDTGRKLIRKEDVGSRGPLFQKYDARTFSEKVMRESMRSVSAAQRRGLERQQAQAV